MLNSDDISPEERQEALKQICKDFNIDLDRINKIRYRKVGNVKFDTIEDWLTARARGRLISRQIGNILIKWGRIDVTSSGSYHGNVILDCNFGIYRLYDLLNPLHDDTGNSFWHKLDRRMARLSRLLNLVVIPWQIFVYRYAYRRAIKRRPDLIEDILLNADHPQWLKSL